jgi:hypothetical protein
MIDGASPHRRDFAVVQRQHAARVRQHRRDVGGEQVFAVAKPGDKRRMQARADQQVGIVGAEGDDGVRAAHMLQGAAHRSAKSGLCLPARNARYSSSTRWTSTSVSVWERKT